MSIAREFIRRGREIEREQAEFPLDDAEMEAEEWDHAIWMAYHDSALNCVRGKTDYALVVSRTMLDFQRHRPPTYIIPEDYGRGTVALIVKHAEDRAP
jgi:hypothetical protein